MKKFIIIFLSVICIAGVVALGYLVFNSKSIETVEIEGQMQTLYVAGQDIDFEGAKLKVTYKNGNVKFIDMTNKNVKVTQFSTSLKTHGTMKITYKSKVLEVSYDVIESGMYYLSAEQSYFAGETPPQPTTYDAKSTQMLLYIRVNGELDYYYLDNSGRYCMYDGSYDKSYRYDIVGDSLNAYLGDDANVISIKADYSLSGNVEYKSTRVYKDNFDLEISRSVKTFTYYEMKSDNYRTITNSDIDLSRTSGVVGNVVSFNVGENIKTSGKVMFLAVRYGNDDFMTVVYVHICDGMVANNSLDTEFYTDADTMYIYYQKGSGHTQQTIHYKVV